MHFAYITKNYFLIQIQNVDFPVFQVRDAWGQPF